MATITIQCLSIEEAAEALSISPRSVQRLIQTGQLASSKIGGRVLILEDDLEALLKAHRRVSCATANRPEIA